MAAQKAEKARKEAEQKAKKEAEQKAKKEAEQKAKKEAEQKAKKEAEQKAKKEAEQKAKKEAEQKAVGGKETATALKKFTRDSKLKDLGALGEGTNSEFEFNEGVLQTDGNGDYIWMDGEKYYAEKYYENNDQKRDLKYFYVTTNTTAGVKIQF